MPACDAGVLEARRRCRSGPRSGTARGRSDAAERRVGGRAADRHGPGVRRVGEQRAERDDHARRRARSAIRRAARAQNARQRMFGSMPRTSTTSPLGARRAGATESRVVGQSMRRVPPSVERDVRPVDLEVVVVLGVELGERRRRPRLSSRCSTAARGGLAGVVPALERGDQHRVDAARARRRARSRDHRLPARVRSSDQPYGAAASTVDGAATPVDYVGAAVARLHPCRPCRPSIASCDALRERVVVADGAMGTMLQAAGPGPLDDFAGPTRAATRSSTSPGRTSSAASTTPTSTVGVDCVETNTFGANLRQPRASTTSPTGSTSWPRPAPGSPARSADELVDAGPAALGARLGRARAPSCRRSATRRTPTLRDAYQAQAAGLLAGGADAVLVETCQDLLQAKAAVIGATRAMAAAGADVPLIVARSPSRPPARCCSAREIGAALTALEPLGIDLIGLNCATGPAEMSEHLRHLSRHARIPLSCMPNAGLPELGPRRRALPADARTSWPTRTTAFVTRVRRSRLVGGCCGTTPEHLRQVVERGRAAASSPRAGPRPEPGVASLYQHVPFRQDTVVLSIGERTNANGSKAFREAMLAERLGRLRRDRPRPDPRRRAPARPVRRLRRPRRRRRHARAGRPVRHRVHAADRARLHRAGR